MPSKQDTFDKIVSALVAQGRGSIDDSGSCKYRSADGCKCAVGHLIPDDRYDPIMEGIALTKERPIGPLMLNNRALVVWDLVVGELGHDALLCADMQKAHDECAKRPGFVEHFKEQARTVATCFDLNTAVLDT